MEKQFKALVSLVASMRVAFGMFMIDVEGRIGLCDFGGQKHWHVYYPDLEDYVKEECSGISLDMPVVHYHIKDVKDSKKLEEMVFMGVEYLRAKAKDAVLA